MKYKLTKEVWERIGKQTGWIKEAEMGASGLEDGPGPGQKYDQDIDIKESVKNEDDAVRFVLSMDPLDLASFLGMKGNELAKRVSENKGPVFTDIKSDIVDKVNSFQIKKYEDSLKIVSALVMGADPAQITYSFLQLLGLGPGSGEIVERLHTYAPLVIGGPTDLKDALQGPTPQETDKMRNYVLDQYSAGKLTQEEVSKMMKEFAKYEHRLVKTARGLQFRWVKKRN